MRVFDISFSTFYFLKYVRCAVYSPFQLREKSATKLWSLHADLWAPTVQLECLNSTQCAKSTVFRWCWDLPIRVICMYLYSLTLSMSASFGYTDVGFKTVRVSFSSQPLQILAMNCIFSPVKPTRSMPASAPEAQSFPFTSRLFSLARTHCVVLFISFSTIPLWTQATTSNCVV